MSTIVLFNFHIDDDIPQLSVGMNMKIVRQSSFKNSKVGACSRHISKCHKGITFSRNYAYGKFLWFFVFAFILK